MLHQLPSCQQSLEVAKTRPVYSESSLLLLLTFLLVSGLFCCGWEKKQAAAVKAVGREGAFMRVVLLAHKLLGGLREALLCL